MPRAVKGDGEPRSEKRKRTTIIGVRVTPEELDALTAKVNERNSHLHPNARKSSKTTIQKFLVDAGLRREFKPVVLSSFDRTAELTELKRIRNAVASTGNMLKTWLAYGAGEHEGKGPTPLKIHADPTSEQRNDVKTILRLIAENHTELKSRIGELS